jgi:hypothetical protein
MVLIVMSLLGFIILCILEVFLLGSFQLGCLFIAEFLIPDKMCL